jgi:zinc/manganese transport system substrate-binding protein
MKRLFTLVLAALCLLNVGLSSAQGAPLNVIATFSILGDLVQNVGGDAIQLSVLVGPDGDTHTYEPIPADSVALGDADVIFENGLGFESWLDDLYAASGSQAQRVVVSAGLTAGVITVGDEAGETDPHIWQNIYNSIHVVEVVRDTLSAADPANAVAYQLNANRYLALLADTDTYLLEQVQTLPADQRKLVTDHDAFGYFASRYGFEIVGAALGVSSEVADPSASDIATLIDAITAAGTRAVFAENILNPDVMALVAEQAGVVVGPPLCSDALTAADGPCPTYVDMMRYNVSSIVGALSS